MSLPHCYEESSAAMIENINIPAKFAWPGVDNFEHVVKHVPTSMKPVGEVIIGIPA